MSIVIEKWKQRLVAIAAKARGYIERVDRFRQNRVFQNNQRQSYKELNQEEERCGDDRPDDEESKKCFAETYGVSR